jgi:hypothetical protein
MTPIHNTEKTSAIEDEGMMNRLLANFTALILLNSTSKQHLNNCIGNVHIRDINIMVLHFLQILFKW